MAAGRNTALDVTGQEPSLNSSLQSDFIFLCIKVQEIDLGHFAISETLSPGDNRCWPEHFSVGCIKMMGVEKIVKPESDTESFPASTGCSSLFFSICYFSALQGGG